MIVEFDGVDHYTNPRNIRRDKEHTQLYEKEGYKVVRIPYFIQLTRKSVKTLFGIDIGKELFDENYPSMGVKGGYTPAYLCPAGLKRMAEELHRFPEQYEANVLALKIQEQGDINGVKLQEAEYNT